MRRRYWTKHKSEHSGVTGDSTVAALSLWSKSRILHGLFYALSVLALNCGFGICYAANTEITAKENIFDLSLTEALEIQVQAPSATKEIHLSDFSIVSAEELRKAGAASLSDALQLAPGVLKHNSDGLTRSALKFLSAHRLEAARLKVVFNTDGQATEHSGKSALSLREISFDQVKRIEVVRGKGIKLWQHKGIDAVIIVVLKSDQHNLLEGAKI